MYEILFKKKDLDEVIKRTNCTCKKYDVPYLVNTCFLHILLQL